MGDIDLSDEEPPECVVIDCPPEQEIAIDPVAWRNAALGRPTNDWMVSADHFEARVGRGDWRRLQVDSPAGRRIDIMESPKGRNHYVYVDGVRYVPDGS